MTFTLTPKGRFAVAVGCLTAGVVGAVALFKRAQGLEGRLGVTARRGPRTGVVEVDRVIVRDRVDQLIDRMTPCDCYSGSRRDPCKRPVNDAAAAPVDVTDVGTGASRRVRVLMRPQASSPGPIGAGHLSTGFVGGELRQDLVVTANSNACAPESQWRPGLRSILVHELAHATDPTLVKAARNPSTFKYVSPTGDRYSYFNSKQEVLAHLAQIQDELTRFGVDTDWTEPPDKILKTSSTFRRMSSYLYPGNRRRFLRLAARMKQAYGRDTY